jgi:phosphatidylinositol alpha-1,6-mannosyltransferase
MLVSQWEIPSESVHVVHPGVDTEFFSPAQRDPEARRRLGWDERPVVLTVGRLQKRKGHDQLIRAIGQIRRFIPEVLYSIVGAGEERQTLEKIVGAGGLANHVQFLGEPSDDVLLTCYRQCDVFALPNRQCGRDIEGFGMVLVEAQACGKPVIAGASGGTAETMHIPETGRVVNCDGADDLAKLLIEWLANRSLLERMGTAARRWAVSHFDWSAVVRKAGTIFEGARSVRHSQAQLATVGQ